MSARSRRRVRTALLTAVVAAVCMVLVFPVYWGFVTSVNISGSSLAYPPELIPSAISFESYRRILSGGSVLRWFANSGFVTLATILLAVPVASLAGYSMSRFKFFGVREVGGFLLVARMLPSTLLIIPIYYLFARAGMLNNHFALVLANTTFILPFASWMMKGFFDSIPRELEEAALIDGGNTLTAFWRIVIPISLPGLAATTIYCSILSWGEFIFAKTLLTGSDKWTVPIGLTSFVQEYTVRWDEVMAAALTFVVPVILLFIVLERYLVQGLGSGGVKG